LPEACIVFPAEFVPKLRLPAVKSLFLAATTDRRSRSFFYKSASVFDRCTPEI
jgi:hypothetical protein